MCQELYDNDEDDNDEDFHIDFADPGGRSALRAGDRLFPCPNCGTPFRLCAEDIQHGYKCDECADRAERGYD